jgi:hypothetical protein
MGVYVDALMDWGWKYGKSCHLLADTEKELHDFARLIGCKRNWFQVKSSPHYDLTERRRKMAITKGAIEIDKKKFKELMQNARSLRPKGGDGSNGSQKGRSGEEEKSSEQSEQ